ncbi:MAG: tRNA (adenosine(37)-N6)-dimethylallyltransferase MiaA [Kiritimatiellaeota bacterium]|nr:tRNA (adenosine(37)-N6)-dimethylallyltransferase MiaA [Kiritimatiellota bacterium]
MTNRTPRMDSGTPPAPPVRPAVVVLGPTATGKTRLGVALARRFNGEIVSADSRQVYRGLDIGTGKDLAEYGAGRGRVRLHLVDVVAPRETYHLHRFVAEAREALTEIWARGRLPIIVGGSGLYLNALIAGYALEGGPPNPAIRERLAGATDTELVELLAARAPDILARTDRTQHRRLVRAVEIALTRDAQSEPTAADPLGAALLLGPYYPRRTVHRRIAERLDARLAAGLLEEVERLHAHGLSWDRLEYFGLEYRWAVRRLRGELTDEQFRESLTAAIRRFAKHQDVWFRKMERQGRTIYWIPGGDFRTATSLVERFVEGRPLPPAALRLDDIVYDSHGNPRRRARNARSKAVETLRKKA